MKGSRCILLIVATITIVADIAYAAVSAMSRRRTSAPEKMEKAVRTDLERFSDFSASSTDTQIERMLVASLNDGQLEELWSVDRPDGQSRLILAAPTPDGRPGQGGCALADRLCGLFVKQNNGQSRLLVRGGRITGFQGLDRFEDNDHAIIVMGFSLYDYFMLGRYTLNFVSGEMVPRLILEIDTDDHSSMLTASGHGDILVLAIDGLRESGRIVPKEIEIQREDGRSVFVLEAAAVTRLAEQAKQTKLPLTPIALHPSSEDTKSFRIQVDLFAVPYLLDLRAKTLEPLMSSR